MSAKPRSVSIYRLAEELNLSPATISRALSNSPVISAETRNRVRLKAIEYGFRPRQISRRTTNICALVQVEDGAATMFSNYVNAILDGMWRYLNGAGLEMSLYSGSSEKLNGLNLPRALQRMNVDGVVIINADDRSGFYGDLNKQKFFYCSVMSNDGKGDCRLITVDNAEAGYRASKHLIDMGHRRIGLLNSIPHLPTGQRRMEGYRRALEERGMPFDPDIVVVPLSSDKGIAFGYNGTVRLIKEHPDVTAMLVLDEQMAVSALSALQSFGKRVPQDFSVLAFDDSPEAIYLQPPLTVLRAPNNEIGYTAARWVHDQIRGDAPENFPHEPWMRGDLLIRDSTGPAPVQP